MNRNQWFVIAFIFLLSALVTNYSGIKSLDYSMEIRGEQLDLLEKALEESNYPEIDSHRVTQYEVMISHFGINAITLLSFSNLYWMIAISCFICGWMEKKNKN